MTKESQYPFNGNKFKRLCSPDINKCWPQINSINSYEAKLSPGLFRLQAGPVISSIWQTSEVYQRLSLCSMWVEKTFWYHRDSCSPQLDHSPPAGVVKYHDLIICVDLILSSFSQWDLLQRIAASWNYLDILSHCSSFTSIHSHKQHRSIIAQLEQCSAAQSEETRERANTSASSTGMRWARCSSPHHI